MNTHIELIAFNSKQNRKELNMASNGLDSTAKSGKCRICQRVRNTSKYLKAVGEVRHGYATGHI